MFTGINEANKQASVRLEACPAPWFTVEQDPGDESDEKVVTVITKKHDRYGRTVGHVLIDKRDVNLELLEDGAVWHYEEYDHNKRLREAEQSA